MEAQYVAKNSGQYTFYIPIKERKDYFLARLEGTDTEVWVRKDTLKVSGANFHLMPATEDRAFYLAKNAAWDAALAEQARVHADRNAVRAADRTRRLEVARPIVTEAYSVRSGIPSCVPGGLGSITFAPDESGAQVTWVFYSAPAGDHAWTEDGSRSGVETRVSEFKVRNGSVEPGIHSSVYGVSELENLCTLYSSWFVR